MIKKHLVNILNAQNWLNHVRRYLLGKVSARLILWVFVLFLGYQLQDKTTYSHFLTFMLASQLISGVINAGMPAAILRFGVINQKEEPDQVSAQGVWGISLTIGVIASACLFLIYLFIGATTLRFPLEMGAITCLFSFLLAQEANCMSIFQLKSRSDLYEKYYILLSIFVLLIIILLYFWGWDNRVFQATLFYVIAVLITLIWATYYAYKLVGLPNIRKWKEPLAYALPLLPHLLGMYFLTSADFFLIKYLLGEQTSSIYGFAYQATSVISMFTMAVVTYLTPVIYESLQNRDVVSLQSISKKISMISGIVLMISFIGIFAFYMIVYYFLNQYIDSIPLVCILAPSFVFHFIYAVAGIPAMFYGKTGLFSLVSLIVAGCNMLGNYITIPIWGVYGAACINVASYALLSMGHVYLMRKTSDLKISFKHPYTLAAVSVSIGLILGFIVK
ncbi:MAG: oligosaccharide flippase family protein [Bacteroidetes Order II. Incertae sedis bacterium]|nr:oligosaccharide flippase family protein [Bacteroidetes Order II. bacterium]